MNRIQWIVFGIGFFILSIFLFKSLEAGCAVYIADNARYIGCMIKRYDYAIPAIITHFVAWMCIVCAIFEFKE